MEHFWSPVGCNQWQYADPLVLDLLGQGQYVLHVEVTERDPRGGGGAPSEVDDPAPWGSETRFESYRRAWLLVR
jgi:hypothetical protein